jgi:hypothetical protein
MLSSCPSFVFKIKLQKVNFGKLDRSQPSGETSKSLLSWVWQTKLSKAGAEIRGTFNVYVYLRIALLYWFWYHSTNKTQNVFIHGNILRDFRFEVFATMYVNYFRFWLSPLFVFKIKLRTRSFGGKIPKAWPKNIHRSSASIYLVRENRDTYSPWILFYWWGLNSNCYS